MEYHNEIELEGNDEKNPKNTKRIMTGKSTTIIILSSQQVLTT